MAVSGGTLMAQLGYFGENVPRLHIIIPDTEGRMHIQTIEDTELPFWTGDKFRKFLKDNYMIESLYFISDIPLKGTRWLMELGLLPGVCNVACPLMQIINSKYEPMIEDEEEGKEQDNKTKE